MGLYFLKFAHVILALGLLSITIYCFVSLPRASNLFCPNKIILLLSFLAMATGTFLVYPKHFTFHTPWIIAAYVLLMGYVLGIVLLMWYKKSWRWAYFLLFMILIGIVHDAVTKTSFLLFYHFNFI